MKIALLDSYAHILVIEKLNQLNKYQK